MGDLREPLDEPAVEGRAVTLVPSLTSTASPNPFSIGAERWATAEEVSQCILQKVQPTAVSEERRRAVIDYVQRLVRGSLGCEVFPYGSVPLKTYLPDGDIDLTIFGGPMMEDALANDLVSLLEEEEHNKGAEFIVTDVQLIRAESWVLFLPILLAEMQLACSDPGVLELQVMMVTEWHLGCLKVVHRWRLRYSEIGLAKNDVDCPKEYGFVLLVCLVWEVLRMGREVMDRLSSLVSWVIFS
nr:uncharacterized protein LOC109179216 isoform X2 [Ipomoea batatas]